MSSLHLAEGKQCDSRVCVNRRLLYKE